MAVEGAEPDAVGFAVPAESLATVERFGEDGGRDRPAGKRTPGGEGKRGGSGHD